MKKVAGVINKVLVLTLLITGYAVNEMDNANYETMVMEAKQQKEELTCGLGDKDFIVNKMKENQRIVVSIQTTGFRTYDVDYIKQIGDKFIEGNYFADYSDLPCR